MPSDETMKSDVQALARVYHQLRDDPEALAALSSALRAVIAAFKTQQPGVIVTGDVETGLVSVYPLHETTFFHVTTMLSMVTNAYTQAQQEIRNNTQH